MAEETGAGIGESTTVAAAGGTTARYVRRVLVQRTMNRILPALDAPPTRAYYEHVACRKAAARRSIFAALTMRTDERADETYVSFASIFVHDAR